MECSAGILQKCVKLITTQVEHLSNGCRGVGRQWDAVVCWERCDLLHVAFEGALQLARLECRQSAPQLQRIRDIGPQLWDVS